MSNLFVVRRVFPRTPDYLAPQSHGSYLRAFTTRTSAEECCAALDRAERHRRDINPFDYGQYLDDCTSFPPQILCDWMLECELTPPETAWEWRHTWRKWWSVVAENATELQIAHIWQATDQVRFFEVVELEWVVGCGNAAKKRSLAYLVRRCLNNGSDEHTIRSVELDELSGRRQIRPAAADDQVLRAYATRTLAKRECKEIEITARRLDLGPDGYCVGVVMELLIEE